jgi:hypothetical protein
VRIRELVERLQVEDLVLAGVVLLGPVLTSASGSFGAGVLSSERDPVGGLFALLAAIGAMAAVATRVPGESRVDASTDRYWIIGPFLGAIGLTAGNALERLGIEGGDVVTGPAFLVALLAMIFADRLPVVERPIRRLLVAPFVVLSGAVFGHLTADVTSALAGVTDLPALLVHPQALGLIVTIVSISLAVSWIFYAMLVFAPRELSDPGTPTRWWAFRFGVFWASVLVSLAIGGAPVVL